MTSLEIFDLKLSIWNYRFECSEKFRFEIIEMNVLEIFDFWFEIIDLNGVENFDLNTIKHADIYIDSPINILKNETRSGRRMEISDTRWICNWEREKLVFRRGSSTFFYFYKNFRLKQMIFLLEIINLNELKIFDLKFSIWMNWKFSIECIGNFRFEIWIKRSHFRFGILLPSRLSIKSSHFRVG